MHGNKACCEDVYQTAAAVSILVLVICFASTQRTDGQASGVSANELARRILMNELEAEQRDQSHWSFRQMAKPKVETQKGELKRALLINGRALTAEQQQKSDKRIRQFVRNPATLRKSLNQKNQDAARSQRLLKMLPDAFHFNYGSAEVTSYS